ncbi:MAG: CHAP domain-containing protein [Novosphingobium sp.]
MTKRYAPVLAALALGLASPAAHAESAAGWQRDAGGSGELEPYLQCVPYAREVSGVQIYGDAHSWWDQAKGRYQRGTHPRVGAVMALKPHGNMQLGHVAAVSGIVDSRTILLRHANWSPINGRRGQIEDNVQAVDVSPGNDWSEVRVWYAPLGALGTTHWPVAGFIYGPKARAPSTSVLAAATPVVRAKSARPDPIGAIIARME